MTPDNDAAPAANGGHIVNTRPTFYTPQSRSATSRIGAGLSPRRKLYAQLVLTLLCCHRARWHDGKVRLGDEMYAVMHDELELDRFGVNQAVDDLYALGLIRVCLCGTTQIITPLAADIEEAA